MLYGKTQWEQFEDLTSDDLLPLILRPSALRSLREKKKKTSGKLLCLYYRKETKLERDFADFCSDEEQLSLVSGYNPNLSSVLSMKIPGKIVFLSLKICLKKAF